MIRMKIFADILDFLESLSFIDYIFFFAVVILMVLIVTLFYFVKINGDVLETKKPNLEETSEMKIAKEITKSLTNPDVATSRIDFTDYEKDQEEKAIISYDELLSKEGNYKINYENEEYLDDLSVKKFDLDNLVTEEDKDVKPEFKGHVISYAKEEEFLKALKQLQLNLK